jgi:transcriptional regulator with XRE-family HTH domain
MNEKKIKEFRKAFNISQEKFAEMSGVTLRTIQNYESGGVIPKSKYAIFRKIFEDCGGNQTMDIGNNIVASEGSTVHAPTSVDNRQYYNDSPDVLRAQINEKEKLLQEKDARIKEKDAQIKEKDAQINKLLSILSSPKIKHEKK